MKRTMLTAAAIAVTFAGLAFIPAQKNNAMEEAVFSTDATEASRCDEKYKTEVTFTECQKTNTTTPIEEENQANVLDQY